MCSSSVGNFITDRKGKVMFSQVFVHNRPHGYSFTAHPCYGAVGTYPTGMLSWSFYILILSSYPNIRSRKTSFIITGECHKELKGYWYIIGIPVSHCERCSLAPRQLEKAHLLLLIEYTNTLSPT